MLLYGSKWPRERKTAMEFVKESEIEKQSPIDEAESSQLSESGRCICFYTI